MQEHGLTQEELTKVIGKKQSTIANKIRIFRMPSAVKEMILAHHLSERHARALIRINNEKNQLQLLSAIIRNKLSVQRTDELVDETLKKIYGEIPAQNANKLLRSSVRQNNCESDIRRMLLSMQKKGADLQYELYELDDKTVIPIETSKD